MGPDGGRRHEWGRGLIPILPARAAGFYNDSPHNQE